MKQRDTGPLRGRGRVRQASVVGSSRAEVNEGGRGRVQRKGRGRDTREGMAVMVYGVGLGQRSGRSR